MAEDAHFRPPKAVEPGWTEEQAAAGHAGLLAILEGIDEPIYVTDPATYEVLFVNRATIRSLGPPNQRRCYEYLQQRSEPCPFCTNDKILGEYLGRSYVWEFRNEALQRWYKCIDKAIPWPNGRLVRYEMAIDIHERKLAEDAVRESERRLRALGDNLPGGMVYQLETQRDGTRRRFSYLSAGVEALHGPSVEEALADSSLIYNQLHEEDRAKLENLEQVALQELTPFRAELRHVHPSGEIRWRLLQSAPRLLPDGLVAWDGVELDITELKLGELERDRLREQLALAQRMESVGRLAGGVAHDFNNMLAVIAGHAEMVLGRAGPEDPLREDLLRIHEAAERSSRLTRQLLAFACRQTAAPRVLDLNRTVEEMLPMLRQILGEGIELSWRPGPESGCVRIDPSQVDQILANLLLNSRNATGGTGRVTLETTSIRFEEEDCTVRAGFTAGDYVLLSVSDDGIGMDAQTLSHIFEPFFTTKPTGQGTGLGLPTVYGILRQNSGFVNVYSEPGQGTTFKLYLPCCAEFPTPTPGVPESPTQLPPTRDPLTILLVEDEPMIRDITRKILEQKDFCVLAADNPTEALHLARHHKGPIHLLLTDVVMPRMSGRELAKKIAEIHPEARQLYMSGYTANVIAHHGVLETGVHFLQKPFSLKVLLAKIREVLAWGAEDNEP
jgi:signal transduction histidine kinase/CheY-like chemotaxis protein